MRKPLAFALLFLVGLAAHSQTLPQEDATRIAEFRRLAVQIEDGIWPLWSKVPDPILLVTSADEFLDGFPSVPPGFHPAGKNVSVRPRQFPINLQATFPAVGLPATIVIGEPANTSSKTSTPWEIVLMHEHFHQLQFSQPGYYEAVAALNLAHGDKTGMWQLNYAFPYADPKVDTSFNALRDQLLKVIALPQGKEFDTEVRRYLLMRRAFMAQLSADDHKYLCFQLWQEGIARFTQILAAEAATSYRPTDAYQHLPDYTPFSAEAARLRPFTLDELRKTDLATAGRQAVYSFGACEGILLERIYPQWRSEYFHHLLSTDPLFDHVQP